MEKEIYNSFLNNTINIRKHKKHNNPKVSVIVPVFKVERYLAQCLNSIINQTLEEIEIIIVDEGLEDRCREIIDFYEKSDPRVVAPHRNNGGYGASCNLGFTLAKGEYIAIVESDDWIEPEMYEEMYNYAKELNADVVKTPYYEYFSNGFKKDCNYRQYMQEVTPSGACFSMKEFGNLLSVHASLWAAIYKTEYIKDKNIQFITAKGGAYVDVGFRIDTLINTDKVAWLDKPYYNYRIDSEGSTTNNFNLDKMIQRWEEAHQNFSKIKKDYDKYYGKYLILDEYLNTLGWLNNIKVTSDEAKRIYKNLSYVTEKTIIESPVLDKYQKKDLISFKKNYKKYMKTLKRRWLLRNIKNTLLNIMERIAKPWHLYMPILFLCVSVYMSKSFDGLISEIFNYSAFLWLFIICIYIVNMVIYELIYLLLLVRHKLINLKRDK